MYELHIANKNYSSWSLRPWLLMQVLQIPFRERLWVFAASNNHERFRSFSPTGRVPCLHDEGTVVWDSLAIAEYLAERHAGVWSAAAPARAWARCAAAEMHSGFPALRNGCSMNCGTRVRLHGISAELRAEVGRLDELWSEGLQRSGGPWLAGSAFGAVDAFFGPVAFRAQTYSLPLGQPAADYVARLLALPAMQRWYADAIAETWRDPSHEEEVLQAGEIVADLRATGLHA
jgi:glutathione S-transferase